MTLLLAGYGGLTPAIRAWVGFANILGTWTMFPLLKRDDLTVPYYVLTLLWAYLLGLPPTSLSTFRKIERGGLGWFAKLIHLGFYLAMFVWHVCEVYIDPPHDKPDLWVVTNVLVGAAGFGVCYLWCLYNLVLRSGYLGVEMKSKVI
jgi:alpha-1,3-glucosyltransferase